MDTHPFPPIRLWTPQEQELSIVHYFRLAAQHHAWQKGTEQMFLKNEGKVTYFQLQSYNTWILTLITYWKGGGYLSSILCFLKSHYDI